MITNQQRQIIGHLRKWTSSYSSIRSYSTTQHYNQYKGLMLPKEYETKSHAERRNYIKDLGEDELARKIIAMSSDLKQTTTMHGGIASFMNVPVGEVNASPFTLRAMALAMNSGVSFTHHESRRVMSPNEDYEHLKRKDRVAKIQEQQDQDNQQKQKQSLNSNSNKKKQILSKEASGDQELVKRMEEEERIFKEYMEQSSRWVDGELEMPQYASFHQEDQFASYNPAHIDKWTPHEAIHRWCRFYWREDMTKWDMYIGCKLNEIIPVLHWHSLDEILRNSNWTTEQDERTLLRSARQTARLLQGAIGYFNSELDIIEREIFKGLNTLLEKQQQIDNNENNKSNNNNNIKLPEHVKDWKELNSVTDTMIYVQSHYPRITTDPFNLVMEALKSGRDYIASIKGYRAFIEERWDDLLFKTVTVDTAAALNERDNRAKIDLLMREANRQFQVYYTYAMSGDQQARADQRKLSHLCTSFKKKTSIDFLTDCKSNLHANMFETGLMIHPINNPSHNTIIENTNQMAKLVGLSSDQILEGLYTVIPGTIGLINYILNHNLLADTILNQPIDNLLTQFSKSKYFYTRDKLSNRFIQFLYNNNNGNNNNTLPNLFKHLIEYEMNIIELNLKDEWIEELSVIVDADEEIGEKDMENFTIMPSRAFKLFVPANPYLSEIHKTFAGEQDIDEQIQELEFTINNQKILDREIKKRHSVFQHLIKSAIDYDQLDQSTKKQLEKLHLIGTFENQFYSLDLIPMWKEIWPQLESQYRHGIKYSDLKTIVSLYHVRRCEPFDPKDQSLKQSILDLSQYGAVEFAKQETKNVTPELMSIIDNIAVTGVTCYPWIDLKELVFFKLQEIFDIFESNENQSNIKEEELKNKKAAQQKIKSQFQNHFKEYKEPPFTIQRLCELVVDYKIYKSYIKYLSAVEKMGTVTSTIPALTAAEVVEYNKSISSHLPEKSNLLSPSIPIEIRNQLQQQSISTTTVMPPKNTTTTTATTTSMSDEQEDQEMKDI
ncbi:hypothetical protein DFA_06334 [Cavenderia fasciculata]|uniref:Uncharacterized protein n=1 Tax=Cavenderia fasciculata TaxID=261658 RepID=F4PKR3_CACFS|nr:uncharacterized protein DFA_06334 [Cavenderia fasciculata]EGG24187.1 hypothetical protein DFA_06334 [Cavenderia fasciculata]|eukprot:XP_004362038.1 hypothetical protein DFA_06334 [Cavenderia fasciculata]